MKNGNNSLEELIKDVRQWFDERNLDHAVVGFSGGIDSSMTAALLHSAGIGVTLVLALKPNQRRESNFDVYEFIKLYDGMESAVLFFDMPLIDKGFNSLHLSDAANEAALPIMRNACFYGIAAQLRKEGKRPVCVGTANFDEAAYLGFWGKASDGAQDFYPISHLHKWEVKNYAVELGVPEEIIKATPSGDLQWSGDLNDLKMIGATYDQIEGLAKLIDKPKFPSISEVIDYFMSVDDPTKFIDNIQRNRHKYEIPFGQKHLSDKLERFRKQCYPIISAAANFPQVVHKT